MTEGSAYNLTNTEFETITATNFRNLYINKNFTDVTIACDDGKTVKAHKVVLSASSTVLHNILMQYYDANPLLYFGDTSFKHIEYILRYVYFGEVSVKENELKEFMEIATKFKINGIYSDETEKVNLDGRDD